MNIKHTKSITCYLQFFSHVLSLFCLEVGVGYFDPHKCQNPCPGAVLSDQIPTEDQFSGSKVPHMGVTWLSSGFSLHVKI